MAEAFIKGLLSGGFPAGDIHFFEPNEKRRELVVDRYGISCAVDNEALVEISDIVVLATKPQILDKVLKQVNGAFNDDKFLISILAGVTTTTLEAGLGGQARVVRAMPNTPALAGRGAAALCPGLNITEEDRRVAQAAVDVTLLGALEELLAFLGVLEDEGRGLEDGVRVVARLGRLPQPLARMDGAGGEATLEIEMLEEFR